MPIIPVVGRKKASIRILIAVMYVVLTVGAVLMIYPFLLMLGMSITTEVDKNELRIIPKYVYNNEALYQKYLDRKYNGDIKRFNEQMYLSAYKFAEVKAPLSDLKSAEMSSRIKDYEEFKASLPTYYKATGFTELRVAGRPTLGEVQKQYQDMLRKKFSNDINEFNKAYVEEVDNFQLVWPPREQMWLRIYQYDDSTKTNEWIEFKSKLESRFTYALSVEGIWWKFLATKFDSDIKKLNNKYKTAYNDFNEIRLAKTVPNDQIKPEWEDFIRTTVPLRYIRFAKGADAEYLKFVSGKYKNNIVLYNKLNMTKLASFAKIEIPAPEGNLAGAALGDLNAFVKGVVSIRNIYTETTENLYEKFLTERYKTVDAVNKEYKTEYKKLSEALPPYFETDWFEVLREAGKLRNYFVWRNYSEVVDYIVLHGAAVLNTVFYCLIMVLTVLTVNPFCAYVLSRFNFSYAYKILLFLLATMAFPYEVSMIPNFILLKNLGFLNTFWALILPGLASGYSIFILKGFFDSLPKELFEAAKIDGVSEMGTYWKIVLPLTKPVMAYLALGAYTAAYGAFMYALIVCQNPKMWTLMVWLYEMQNWAPQFLIMSALVLAALPTLLVFIFFQNIIIKGIILPVEQ